MVARDPDAIQREIETTRVELAETIDAIAEKVSPQRAAERGKVKLKALVEEFRGGASAQLRTDRVAIAGGALATMSVLLLVVRRRRRRRRPANALVVAAKRRR